MSKLKFAFGFAILVAGITLSLWPAPTKPDRPVKVLCETTKGQIEIIVKPDWSPLGAERFLSMVDQGFFHETPLFRCVSKFVCQFGPSPNRADGKVFNFGPIADDPRASATSRFKPGYLSFAGAAANSRSFHIFIALDKVDTLGRQPWETPFGYVTDATFNSVVSQFYTGYGDMPPFGNGPDSALFAREGGEDYLKSKFPNLDRIQKCQRAPITY